MLIVNIIIIPRVLRFAHAKFNIFMRQGFPQFRSISVDISEVTSCLRLYSAFDLIMFSLVVEWRLLSAQIWVPLELRRVEKRQS